MTQIILSWAGIALCMWVMVISQSKEIITGNGYVSPMFGDMRWYVQYGASKRDTTSVHPTSAAALRAARNIWWLL